MGITKNAVLPDGVAEVTHLPLPVPVHWLLISASSPGIGWPT